MANSKKNGIEAHVAHALSRLGVKSTSSVLIAVSGGVDSMTLAFVLNDLRKHGHMKKLALVHINHSLRGKEADKDALLVKQYAEKLKLPFYTFTVDTRAYAIANRTGIEEAARELRYQKISEAARKHKFQFIATAHTAHDQAETVLMNIVRGTGLNGLQGIPESRVLIDRMSVIRPFLSVGKNQLLDLAREHRIPFREDESNSSLDFQRNRIRHLVLPKLEKAFKDRDIYAGFARMTQNISSVRDYIDEEVSSLYKDAIVETPLSFFTGRRIVFFKREALLTAPGFLRRELIIRESSAMSNTIVSLDQVHTALMESYLSYPSSKTFPLSQGIILSHDGKYISIELLEAPPVHEHLMTFGKKIVTPVGVITMRKVKKWQKPVTPDTAYFKPESFTGRKLLLRYWKPGDKMKPFGMKGKSRLVSDILSEAGIKSARLKYFIPVIVFEDEKDLILWIPGLRSAEFGILDSRSETAIELHRIIGN